MSAGAGEICSGQAPRLAGLIEDSTDVGGRSKRLDFFLPTTNLAGRDQGRLGYEDNRSRGRDQPVKMNTRGNRRIDEDVAMALLKLSD